MAGPLKLLKKELKSVRTVMLPTTKKMNLEHRFRNTDVNLKIPTESYLFLSALL